MNINMNMGMKTLYNMINNITANNILFDLQILTNKYINSLSNCDNYDNYTVKYIVNKNGNKNKCLVTTSKYIAENIIKINKEDKLIKNENIKIIYNYFNMYNCYVLIGFKKDFPTFFSESQNSIS